MMAFAKQSLLPGVIRTVAALALTSAAIFAAAPSADATDARELNRGRIGLLTGASTDTSLSVAADLARVLDGKSNLRIVPYLSGGSVHNIEDLMSYRFVDLALINSDALLSRKLQNPNDQKLNRINYIARLFTSEVHVLTRTDSGVHTLSDLEGRRFAAGDARSGSFLTASLLMRASGVRGVAIAMPTEQALIALESGEIDAVFFLAAKPSAFLRKLEADANFALVQVPLTENLAGVYRSGEFTSDDYPGIVQDKYVETVSVDVILAAYGNAPAGSEKYEKLNAFVGEMERSLAQFRRPPSHAKWQQFSFDAEIEGLERNAAAVAALSGDEAEATDQPSIFDLMREGVGQ